VLLFSIAFVLAGLFGVVLFRKSIRSAARGLVGKAVKRR
jgi:hypothetical protein